MKIGLLSDIHANAHALKAVIKSAKERSQQTVMLWRLYWLLLRAG